MMLLFFVFNVQHSVAHRDTDDSKWSIFIVSMRADVLTNDIKPLQALWSSAPDKYVSKQRYFPVQNAHFVPMRT